MSIIYHGMKVTQPIVDTVIADSVNPIQNKAVHTYTTNNENLVTTAKSIVGAINENAEKIAGMTGVVSVKVVATLPAAPVEKTIYYVGSAAPYQIKLYVDGDYTDLGTTSVDLSGYVQKTDIVDNLTSTASDKPLSAMQGYTLDTLKVGLTDIKDELTSTAANKVLSANQGRVLKGLVDEKLPLAGGTMTGDVVMGTNAIKFGNNNKQLKASGDSLQYDGKTITSMKVTTTGVSFSPTTGITGGVDVQRNFEYDDHYEYNFILRLGNIPVQSAQIPLGSINGIAGNSMFSHTPVPVWYEQGQPSGNGLIYNGGGSYNLYVSGNTVANNTVTFSCRLITTK